MAGKVGDSSKLFRRAIRMFAQEHSLDFTKVTQEKVEKPRRCGALCLRGFGFGIERLYRSSDRQKTGLQMAH